MPLLTADRSLQIARLPEGDDPDSLARRDPALLRALLDRPMPLAVALYGLVREQVGDDTPERRAQLRQRLEAAAARIADRALAREFRGELLGLFFAARRSGRTGVARAQGSPPRSAPNPTQADAARWDILLGLALGYPAMLHDVHEALALLHPPAGHKRLHSAILALPEGFAADPPLDTAAVMNHLRNLGLADIAAQALKAVVKLLPASVPASASPAEVEATWWHFFGLMDPTRLDDEINRARAAFEACSETALLRRLTALVEAREAMRRGETSLDDGS